METLEMANVPQWNEAAAAGVNDDVKLAFIYLCVYTSVLILI